MKNLLTIIILSVFLSFSAGEIQSQVMIDETAVDTNTVITGLDIPWEILYGPDGWLWLTERFGRVSRVHPETGEQVIILDHSETVAQQGESGMLGMALHPDFPQDPRVYIVYTYQSNGIKERLVYFTYDGTELTNETILIDGIQGNSTHDGSRLLFAPDGKLMMTTGDAQNLAAPQDINHLSGKILRINPDGSIPEDNPFGDSYVYTWGHRNAQGLAFGPDGTLYSSEHGPSTDDEINIIEATRNYGWPEVKGFCDTPGELDFCEQNNVREPLVAWTPTIAPSDIIYYNSNVIPEWKGSILLTLLKNKRLVELELSEDGQEITGENHYFVDYWGRLRDICVGPNGEIYLATSGDSWSNTNPFTHSIIRLQPEGSTGAYLPVDEDNAGFTLKTYEANLIVESDKSFIDSRWMIMDMGGRVRHAGRIEQSVMTLDYKLETGVFLFTIHNPGSITHSQKFFIP